MRQPTRPVWMATAAVVVGIVIVSCGGRPKPEPVSAMADRYRSRISLVDFVVKDPARRARVVRLYEAIEQLTLAFERRQATATGALLAELRGERSYEAFRTDLDEIHARAQADTHEFLERYAALQVRLRGVLTEDEFERLDAIR